jgi:hypothetical protein
MKENEDYVLIPAKGVDDNDQAWDVRILTGEFNETVIRFGNVQIDGKNDQLRFNFMVILAPSDYITEDNEELQGTAASILEDLLVRSIEGGTAIIDERK